jgi:hypothetical protein
LFFFGCENNSIKNNLIINRFENEFYNSSKDDLQLLIKKYPYLFPKQYPIETWESFLKDSIRLAIFDKSSLVFNDFVDEKKKLLTLFLNIEENIPTFSRPKVITLNSQSEYENRVIYSDSLLLISLDSFLGDTFYPDLPKYISTNMTKQHLIIDVSTKILEKFVRKPIDRTLLSEMIYHGKIIYLNKFFNADEKDFIQFRSTNEKLVWANENERNIWSFFIENDFLFSTKNDLKSRFILFAPFSKFNLDIDKQSPGSIGKWLGYKIVNSYMKNNNVNVKSLLNEDYYEIFIKSKYKPKK